MAQTNYFSKKANAQGLTFDDVLVVPASSSVLPREVELRTNLTKKLPLNIPLLSAAMDTVTENQTAIAIAREGGIGIIHKNMPIEHQAEQVRKVKGAEYWVIKDPLSVSPETTLGEIIALRKERQISSFPVVKNGKLVGIITNRDLMFEDRDSKKASEMMTKDLITIDRKVNMDEAKEILHKNKIEKLPIVDASGVLKGLITATDIQSRQLFPNANKDAQGRLLVGASIGPAPKDYKRVEALIAAEVDVLVVDTAHGHSKMVVDATRKLKKKYDIELVAGNIATAEAASALIAAGADAVKVGVGPGAICTTRVVSGVGYPQVSAIQAVADVASPAKIPVIADGGIRYSGDIVKAIVAGADSVMIGSLFAGCEETPGKTIYMYNRKFKQYRGMGSLGAMTQGSAERYFQVPADRGKLVPEGIEGIVPYRGAISEVVFQLAGGLRSGMGYSGARNILELKKAELIRITAAGIQESHPHNVTITDEAPNYSVK